MKYLIAPIVKAVTLTGSLFFISCTGLYNYSQPPEIESFQQGIKTSAAIGYCAAVVSSVHEGRRLPGNVSVSINSGLIRIKVDDANPLPFSKGSGDILIASRWSGEGGIMSVLFSGIDILEGKIKLYGLWAVPLMENHEENNIRAYYADQDIILGYGSDTILDLSNISNAVLNSRLGLLETDNPDDAFVAVKQNIWITTIQQNGTYSDIYDDDITINGGGQIAEVQGSTGGVVYHAVIGTRINYSLCKMNPVSGFALLQNFKAGGEPLIDLASAYISFHSKCDGKAYVEFSSGKYISSFGKDIVQNLN